MMTYVNWKYFLGLFLFGQPLFGQGWKPAMEGISPVQKGSWGYAYNIEFKTDGPLGRDWIYGGYYDQDSLRRCVAYREGGRWKPLPFFSSTYENRAADIEMYGDTLYIAGSFGGIVLDKDSSTLPNTGLLKWYSDSLWTSSTSSVYGPIYFPDDMTVKGDTLLIWGGVYIDPPDTITHQFMTTDGGTTWQYPYSIVHPTSSFPDFGAPPHHLEILDNGDILTINNDSPRGNPFSGLARWDGQQWHAYGNGLFGSTSRVFDFEFYQGELYMGGTFNRYDFPGDPANFVARWDGNQWQELANGTTGFVKNLFVHDSILYCHISGGTALDHQFGDVKLQYLAGWNGQQWCGTYFSFFGAPASFGFVNDTLFVTYYGNTKIGNDPVTYMNYYDGDYLNGPNAVCSTPGLGGEEVATTEAQLKIFPNPTSSQLKISFTGGRVEQVKVYNLSGKCVLEKSYEGLFSVEFDISALAKGVYVLEVNGRYNERVVKM